MFFFEKKNQKTFATLEPLRGNGRLRGRCEQNKSFLFLFFKKEVLSSY
jgi:hypothetical protein